MLDFKMKRIDGSEQPLTDYKGKVVMVVNVASKCGLTPQYKGLQVLYEKYHDKGFEILGFPANNFMGQEPGTDDEIATFCDMNYDVSFPLFSKIRSAAMCSGTSRSICSTAKAPIARFLPLVTPQDASLVAAVEQALG